MNDSRVSLLIILQPYASACACPWPEKEGWCWVGSESEKSFWTLLWACFNYSSTWPTLQCWDMLKADETIHSCQILAWPETLISNCCNSAHLTEKRSMMGCLWFSTWKMILFHGPSMVWPIISTFGSLNPGHHLSKTEHWGNYTSFRPGFTWFFFFFPSKWHLISLEVDLDGFCMTIRSHAYFVVVVSDTGRSYAEASESLASPRHSPRSTLEAISTPSPPHSNQRTYCSGSPSSSTNGMHLSSGNSFPHRWK